MIGTARLIRLVGALGLFGYSCMLALRTQGGGARHVGGDVVAFAYGLAAFLVLAGAMDYYWSDRVAQKRQRQVVDLLSLCGIAAWLAVHLGGSIYSHGSMFAHEATTATASKKV